MIIFINGAFGVGKTTVAQHLAKELPNALLFDPEEVGFLLRNILKDIDPQDDFQHYPLWRTLTVATAKALKETYQRDLIIPMTIWRQSYFDEVIAGLKVVDPVLHLFCLTAPLEVVHERLEKRGEQLPGSWPYQQAYEAVPALASSHFGIPLSADSKTPQELVCMILKEIGHVGSA